MAAGCSEAQPESRLEPSSFSSIQDAFSTIDTIYLEDVPGDTIAQIGPVDVSPNGDMVIADRFLPRVRLYASDGRFVAGQGRFGDGPFEYRQIHSVAMDRSRRVFVHSQGAGRSTVLTPTLLPDTTIPLDSGFVALSLVQRFRDGVVQAALMEDATSWYVYRDGLGVERWRIQAGPKRIFEVPYWSSVAAFLTESAGDTLIVGNSLLYPLRLYSADGASIGELGSPPPSYREVPAVERGAFAFSGPPDGSRGNALADWLGSFTVIAGLHVIEGRWLVVSHGRISAEPPAPLFETLEYAVDMYDLRSGAKVLEDVPLPDGARVLGGGPYLHVLVAIAPQPWTILRLGIRPELLD